MVTRRVKKEMHAGTETRQINLRLPPEVQEPFERMAAEEDRSVQYFLRKAAEEYLAKRGRGPGKPRDRAA